MKISMNFIRSLVVGLTVTFTAASAQAAPVTLSYTGIVSDAGSPNSLPGFSNGQTISFVVTADNGSSSLLSQTWNYTDILGATFSVGTYFASTFGPILMNGYGSFATDAAGSLDYLYFKAAQTGNDNDGPETFTYFMNGGNAIWYRDYNGNNEKVGAVNPPDITNTSIKLVSAVPLPAALPLYGAGLAVMGFIGWRRKRKTAATV